MKLTYYTGAGASFNSIPTVGDEFNKQFILFSQIVAENSKRYYPHAPKHLHFIEKVIEQLPFHYSIDTYARKLFFNDKKEYESLKFLLSYFFIFKQYARNFENSVFNNVLYGTLQKVFPQNRKTIDQRYDVIYAALLDETTVAMPQNIFFISWNYDLQLEMSYSEFAKVSVIDATEKLKVYPNTNAAFESVSKVARFIKLNGTAGLVYQRTAKDKFDYFKFKTTSELLQDCVADIRNTLDSNDAPSKQSILHFAWEQNYIEINHARERAKTIIGETDILVVIGYSFPIYNRRIDRDILSSLSEKATVYLQIPDDRYQSVEERLKATIKKGVSIHPIKDTDQFFVPDELIV